MGAGLHAEDAVAVVESHDSLDDRYVVLGCCPCEEIPKCIGPYEVGIQILGPGPYDPAVEHGVDVIGSALERRDLQTAVYQCLKDTACYERLPASAGGRRYEEPGQAHLPLTTAI